jgi:hypothetical protein
MKAFSESTVVREEDDGVYACAFDPQWSREIGIFGGAVVAVVLRACAHSVSDSARPIRSLTLHCPRPAQAGEARVKTRIEHQGKTVTHLTARVEQQDKLIAFGSAVYGLEHKDALAYQTAELPPVADPETLEPMPADAPFAPPFAGNFEYRYAFGGRQFFGGSDSAEIGGFIRPRVSSRLDAPLAAAMLDAWPTVAMMRSTTPVLTATVVRKIISCTSSRAGRATASPRSFAACGGPTRSCSRSVARTWPYGPSAKTGRRSPHRPAPEPQRP